MEISYLRSLSVLLLVVLLLVAGCGTTKSAGDQDLSTTDDLGGDLGGLVGDLTQPTCGNGVIDPGETCDDGNATPGDGCSATCQVEIG